MSLILLLLVVILWMISQTGGMLRPPMDMRAGLVGFFGFYAILILTMGLWSRGLARRVMGFSIQSGLRKFHKMMTFARIMVPVVFGLGVFWLGWGWLVREHLDIGSDQWPIKLPNVVIGISPAILAWVGLWWSQYPADRALREQSLLLQLEAGVPIHAPPRFFRYLVSNFRLQILFVILPLLMVIAVRDVIVVGVHVWNPLVPITDNVDSVASLVALALVYVLAPELLRRVLDTQPLPAGPLRTRLQNLCDRTGMHAREILLWKTSSLVGNAAVMGLFPRVRYVLMTDLLLETMTDEQIEAVFAHEIGHIKHGHMLWYVALIAGFTMLGMGPGAWIDVFLRHHLGDAPWVQVIQVIVGLGLFWAGFGFVSRRFERQADVFAARTVQSPEDIFPGTNVGPFGATLFASALRRVAAINNIPIKRYEWIHGSIDGRMQFVQWLAASPHRTTVFDRLMTRLYLSLSGLILLSGALLWYA
jgi:STE24 endopeptidase